MSDKSVLITPDGTTYVGRIIAGEVRTAKRKGYKIVLLFEVEPANEHKT